MRRPASGLHGRPPASALRRPAGIDPEGVGRPWSLLGRYLAQYVPGGPPSCGGPATDKPEHDQHHDAEEESHARQVRPELHQVGMPVLGEQPGAHEEQAGHQQHGA
jgi:hypothetical protein